MSILGNLKDAFRPFDEDEYMENEASAEETAAFDELPQSAPYAEEYQQPAQPKSPVFTRREAKAAQPRPAAPVSQPYSAPVQAQAPRMALLFPGDLNEAAVAADNLREHRTVFINIEKTDSDSARRIIDFLSGVVYALGGKIVRVSAQAYLLTPTEDTLVGSDTSELENLGLYF